MKGFHKRYPVITIMCIGFVVYTGYITIDIQCEVNSQGQVKGERDAASTGFQDPYEIGHETGDSSLVKEIAIDLQKKITEAAKTHDKYIAFRSCADRNIKDHSNNSSYYTKDACLPGQQPCLRTSIPVNLEERITSLLRPDYMSTPPHFKDVIKDMRRQVKGHYDVIIASALSSNHLLETQGMLKNFHQNVVPELGNYTMLLYDLGMTKGERMQVEKHCRCKVLDFPFHRLPDHFSTLRCFAWKVFIIAAHLQQAEVLIWADASVRWRNSSAVPIMVDRTRRFGVQHRSTAMYMKRIPYHTLPQVFESFGDSPCAFLSFILAEGGFGMFHREPLIEHAVIGPWVTCASTNHCICPVNQSSVQLCALDYKKTSIGWCNRGDQSAISIIYAKLFREKYNAFAVDTQWFMTFSRSGEEYFKELEER